MVLGQSSFHKNASENQKSVYRRQKRKECRLKIRTAVTTSISDHSKVSKDRFREIQSFMFRHDV